MRWRVLIADGLAEEGIRLLSAQAEVIRAEDLSALGTVEALIVRSRVRVTAADLERAAPRLKVIGRAGVGVDNIDLDAARRTGVIVVNAPEAASVAVAEHALALMLALARRLPEAAASLRRGEWRKGELQGSELAGKTLGLVGFGRIGQALAGRASALGMRVMAYDPLLAEGVIRGGGATPADLVALLTEADYVSLHVPLTEETRGLFGRQALQAMKPGARLISTSRGGVVEEQALLAALESGHLGGAALDVFEREPPGLSPLVTHPAVIATPHIAAQTAEAQGRAACDIAEEVLSALRGKPLRWRVV